MSTRCGNVEIMIGYQFHDRAILQEALTAPGNRRMTLDGKTTFEGNTGLAIIGDATLRLVNGVTSRQMGLSKGITSRFLYRSRNVLTGTQSGDTDQRFKAHATNDIMARHCDSSGLTLYIVPAGGVMVLVKSTKATAMEAVIGAVFLDGGYDALVRS